MTVSNVEERGDSHTHEHEVHTHDGFVHVHDGHVHDEGHTHGQDSHTHEHDEHDHQHSRGAAAEAAPRGGPVALDIGGDIGAVIARLDDDQEGTELPILALDDPNWDPHTHTGVWRRAIGNRSVVVAVYPELLRGRYRITVPHGHATDFEVTGGSVTEIDLRTQTH
jgi:hypothetical protein